MCDQSGFDITCVNKANNCHQGVLTSQSEAAYRSYTSVRKPGNINDFYRGRNENIIDCSWSLVRLN